MASIGLDIWVDERCARAIGVWQATFVVGEEREEIVDDIDKRQSWLGARVSLRDSAIEEQRSMRLSHYESMFAL